MRKRFGLFGQTVGKGNEGSESSGLGLSGVRADVLGNIEHDRLASAGSGDQSSSAEAKRASLGGLLGGMLGAPAEKGSQERNTGQAAEAGGSKQVPESEVKMEEEEL